ncbi:DUF3551 domain-containing protein [Bradyrhizobium sp. SYSU BS000235]|uniref:DUF3551 domain-containing protein n=1 Tax=Bradyrhizobium sp. SYSU BS000235 TaxID=3411332 RepID=UPI003C753F14
MTVTVLAAFAAGGAANATNYKYCLKSSPGPGDCKYQTYKQCQAAMSGINATCVRNYGPR